MITDKQAFLTKFKVKTEDVVIDGETIRVAQLGATDYLKIWTDPAYQDSDGNVDMSKFTPALLAYTIVDDSGNRIFSNEEIDDLGKIASGPFLEVAKVAKKLNGLSGEEAKNSEAGQTISSSTDCACDSDSHIRTTSKKR